MNDLNRRIADALGWTDIHTDRYWYEQYDSDGWVGALFGTPPGSQDKRPLPDYEHDLNAAHQVVASVLSYRIEHQYTLGGVQGGLTLIIESVQFPEIRQRIASFDDAAPYLLERWLEIHAAWKAGQGDV